MCSQKLETRKFQAIPCLKHISRNHPHRSLVCPHANGSPHQLPPFNRKETRDLFFFFCLEYSKNERLYLGESQRGRACFLRRDGAAKAWEGSPRAQHQERLGTRGHWLLSVENCKPASPQLAPLQSLVLVLRPSVLRRLLRRTQSPPQASPEPSQSHPPAGQQDPKGPTQSLARDWSLGFQRPPAFSVKGTG